jgi:hypothetical protein
MVILSLDRKPVRVDSTSGKSLLENLLSAPFCSPVLPRELGESMGRLRRVVRKKAAGQFF